MAQIRRREPKSEPVVRSVEPQEYPETPAEPVGPKVTAILVGHNRAAALRRAIEALERSQNRENLEILVVDCGSDDESPDLDTDFPAITMMRLPHNFGATKAMNVGTRTAKGEMLFYLSPDVEVAVDTVTKLYEKLEADAEAAAVCPLLVDAEGRTVSKIQKIPTSQSLAAVCRGEEPPLVPIDIAQESISVEYPGIDALMVRRQFIKSMNYFDERYGQFWADADMALRARRAQKRIRLYPGIRVVFHPEPSSDDPALTADRILGAATFLGKYAGLFAGLAFRIKAILRALVRFNVRQVSALVSGQKLDGSQVG